MATDLQLCATVCRTASLKGWKLTRHQATRKRIAFMWLSPDGQTHLCPSEADEQAALTKACQWLLPNLAR